jgi:DNA-binding MarR family transcriptional regulator
MNVKQESRPDPDSAPTVHKGLTPTVHTGICDAVATGQHSMTDVGKALGLTVSRVSRIVKAGNER